MSYYIYNITFEKKAEEYFSKIELIEIGMSASEVINILGRPNEEEWMSTKGMGDEIENIYEQLYALKYKWSPSLLDKVLGQVWGLDIFYLDEENGHVVCSDHFMY